MSGEGNYCPRICKILSNKGKSVKQRWHPQCWLQYIASYALPPEIECLCKEGINCKKAEVLAVRWKNSKKPKISAQSFSHGLIRIKPEFCEVGVQTDELICPVGWRLPSVGAGSKRNSCASALVFKSIAGIEWVPATNGSGEYGNGESVQHRRNARKLVGGGQPVDFSARLSAPGGQ